MRKVFGILVILALSGCAQLEMLDNRVSCTVGGDQAYVNSMYGPLGVTSKISQKDSENICGKEK